MIKTKQTFLPLTLALLLISGCASSPSLKPATLSEGPLTSQYAQGRTLTAAEQQALALRSPERLDDQAPDEPDAIGWPQPPNEDLGNFGQLDDTLFRGARPTEQGMKKLAALGVKLLVDLENQTKPVAQEEAWAKECGIRFVNLPLSIITPPSDGKVSQFLALANDPTNRPLYVHCMQGKDRTGCMAFCYRISRQGWTYDEAYAEAVKYGFHTYLLGLRWFLLNYADHHPKAVLSLQKGLTALNR